MLNPRVVHGTEKWSSLPTDLQPLASAIAGIVRRLVLKGVGGAALSPVGAVLAAYVPEAKGVPGFVGLYNHQLLDKGGDPPPPVSRKSFFRVWLLRSHKSPLTITPQNNDLSSSGCEGAATKSCRSVTDICAHLWASEVLVIFFPAARAGAPCGLNSAIMRELRI